MADQRWLRMVSTLVLGMTPLCASAESAATAVARGVRLYGQSQYHELRDFFGRQIEMRRRDEPDWLLKLSQDEPDPRPQPGNDAMQLVVQQDRRDGADLLTLRHPLADLGAVRAYAGAGLNQSVYYAENEDGPTPLARSRRHRSLGAAAEVGAELRMSEELLLSADLRWADLDRDATALRTEDGPVAADPVSIGVSVAWQFR
jgi:hypothetical protein